MKKIGVILGVFSVLLGCGSAKKFNTTPEAIAAFKAFITQERFEFDATAAFPLQTQAFTSVANSGLLQPGSNSGRIDLTGNASYVKMYGDSISMYLPYFGERRVSGGYGENTNITFKGIPEDYNIQFDSVKEKYLIEFKIHQGPELYDVHLDVFPSKTGNLSINSSQRSSIRYQGNIRTLEDSEITD